MGEARGVLVRRCRQSAVTVHSPTRPWTPGGQDWVALVRNESLVLGVEDEIPEKCRGKRRAQVLFNKGTESDFFKEKGPQNCARGCIFLFYRPQNSFL